MLKKIMKKMI